MYWKTTNLKKFRKESYTLNLLDSVSKNLDHLTISSLLSDTDQLMSGDIMNKAGTHTIIFTRFGNDPTSFYGYEATVVNQQDRVVSNLRYFSDILDYVPRRYNNVCIIQYLPVNLKNIQTMNSNTPLSNPYPPPNPYP